MVKLKPGDRVDCRVKANNIVVSNSGYDDVRTFEVVNSDDEGCYIFIPCFVYINGGMVLDAAKASRMGIDPRFVGEKISYIAESSICKVSYVLDGMKCQRCQDFFIMAAPNTPEGEFWCRYCRENPYR